MRWMLEIDKIVVTTTHEKVVQVPTFPTQATSVAPNCTTLMYLIKKTKKRKKNR